MKIALGTKSKLKIRATEEAFKKLNFTEIQIESFDVPSGVSEQPFGFEETIKGARNRAENALRNSPSVDFSVGIENGLIKIELVEQYFDIPCVCIVSKGGDVSYSFGAGYYIPVWMVEKVINNEVPFLGYLVNEIDSAAGNDPITLFSKGVIKREEVLKEAIMIAVNKIFNKDQYEQN